MTSSRRRGAALLVGLTAGALLVGGIATAAPAGVLPAGWDTALGSATTPGDDALPTSAPSTTAPITPTAPPAPRGAVPAAEPAITPAPTTAPTTTPPAPTTPAPTAAAEQAPPPPEPPVRRAPPPPRPDPPQAPTGPAATVVALTNDARAGAGCAPLRADGRLTEAAQGHSADMASNDYFAHDSQDGRGFDDRIRDAGYPSPGGENIAMGQRNAAEVVQAWMNSPGHRRNIEDCSFTTIGVGLDTRGNYWTQDFGR